MCMGVVMTEDPRFTLYLLKGEYDEVLQWPTREQIGVMIQQHLA